ncbi:MAG: hypothetical protein AMXMBFR56_22760 [Polyangiaceae bacterium]
MGHTSRLGMLAALSIASVTSVATAQTWTGGRTGPALGELFAIDKTGEPGWLYGAEDLAGDGLDSFKQQEMSIDIRTAYASTDAQRFWARVYVSDAASPGGNINAYVFIDSDKSASTGGSAAATDIDPKLTGDPSGGGYEFCLGVKGNQSISLWEWSGSAWTPKNLTPPQSAAEAGAILDPIRLNGDVHGQARAESVRRYLIGKGVKPSRLSAKGYGPDKPLEKGTSDAVRAKNRRVEFVAE